MHKKLEKKYEHVFFFCVWGKKYLDEFTKYTSNSLIKNLRKTGNKKNLLYIWTIKKDLEYLKKKKIIKELSKIINIKFYEFDFIKENYYLKNNKYRFLSILQSLFISSFSFNCKYIWFLYPDFIFSNNSIRFMINKLKKNKKLSSIMLPIPQINSEDIEYIFKKKGFDFISNNLSSIIINNLHKIVKIYDVRNTQLNTVATSCLHEKEYLLMNNFHLHPAVIKTDVKNYNYFNSVFPSLDEGYTNILKEKNIYIPKNSKQVIFASLLGENEYKFPKYDFDIDRTIAWCEDHINDFQRKNLNHTFIFYGKKSKLTSLKFNNHLIKKFKNRILNRLNKSNKELYKMGFWTQLASRQANYKKFENENEILEMNKKYLNKIYKNQFLKTFKKNADILIEEIYKKNKNKTSSIIYKLYKDSFSLIKTTKNIRLI